MIDITLTEQPVDTSKFTAFDQELPCIFLGFAIKNEYDNHRLELNESYNPSRQLFVFEKKYHQEFSSIDEAATFGILPLYGLFLTPNECCRRLAATLLAGDTTDTITIKKYENILSEYNLTCSDSYSYLNKRVYPIDTHHLSVITDDSIGNDGKILQHLLSMDDDKFNFQKFGSFKLLILA